MGIKATPLRIEDPLMLAAVAVELESRAAARFVRLSIEAENEGMSDLKALFARLGHEEEVHREKILQVMAADGELPDVVPSLMADIGLGKSSHSGKDTDERNVLPNDLYHALASAVRSEEKAFAFFSSVAAYATSDAVRDLAESLAFEELEHAALLRRARRTAFHRNRSRKKRWPSEIVFASKEEFLSQARASEIEFLRTLLPWQESDVALQIIMDLTKGALNILRKPITPAPKGKLTGIRNPTNLEVLRAALNEARYAFDYYDCVTARCDRDDVLLEAQNLSVMALDRISTLCAAIAQASTHD